MNFESIKKQYDIKPPNNKILKASILKYRLERPKVKNEQTYTLDLFPNTSTIQLWIRTAGCSFSQKGSCSMCDYWIGEHIISPHSVVYDALAPYKGTYQTLIFNTCGSPLDDNELSLLEQARIWKVINAMGFSVVIIETHANSVTSSKLSVLRKYIKAYLVIEMGMESTNPDVLLYCLNKPISLVLIQKKIELIHDREFSSCVNILLGAPFLSIKDRINDCIKSIQDILKAGTDTCVIFPVNIKEYTLVHYLYKNGLYQPVMGRELVEVLIAFSEFELSKINIAWVKPHKQMNSSYSSPIIAPYFCTECEQPFFDLLDQYLATYDGSKRYALVKKMDTLTQCCKSKLQILLQNEKTTQEYIYLGYNFLCKGTINEHKSGTFVNTQKRKLRDHS